MFRPVSSGVFFMPRTSRRLQIACNEIGLKIYIRNSMNFYDCQFHKKKSTTNQSNFMSFHDLPWSLIYLETCQYDRFLICFSCNIQSSNLPPKLPYSVPLLQGLKLRNFNFKIWILREMFLKKYRPCFYTSQNPFQTQACRDTEQVYWNGSRSLTKYFSLY